MGNVRSNFLCDMAGVDARGVQVLLEVKKKKEKSERELGGAKDEREKKTPPLCSLLSTLLPFAPQKKEKRAELKERASYSCAPLSLSLSPSQSLAPVDTSTVVDGEKPAESFSLSLSPGHRSKKRRANKKPIKTSPSSFSSSWRSAPEQTASSGCSPPRPRHRPSSARRAKVRRGREKESWQREKERREMRWEQTSTMQSQPSRPRHPLKKTPSSQHNSQGRPPPRRQGRGRGRRQGLPHDAGGQRRRGRLLGGGRGRGGAQQRCPAGCLREPDWPQLPQQDAGRAAGAAGHRLGLRV